MYAAKKELKSPLDLIVFLLSSWRKEGTSAQRQSNTLVWQQKNIPQQCKDANIVTISKNKGDRSICENSRGISLLSAAGKVLASTCQYYFWKSIARISKWCQSRSKYSGYDIYSRQLEEQCHKQHKNLFFAFVDLSKAFDFESSVKFTTILWQFLDGMTAKLTLGGLESAPFAVGTGVRQDCVLAPVLFNIFLMCVNKASV